MNALVTGGTGYVGGAIARALRARGDAVRVLARPTSRIDHLQREGIEIATGDILDEASVYAALDGCDTLFHAAAIYKFWAADPSALIRTDVEGTRHVLSAARRRGIHKVVYTSSTRAIGERAGEVGSETTRHSGTFQTVYDEAKYRAELVAHDLAREGLPIVIVNPSGVFGPGGVGDTSEALVKALNGKLPMVLHGLVSLVYVDDAVAGHLLAAERGRPGERYILSGGNVDAADWIRQGCMLVGVRRPIAGPTAGARLATPLMEAFARLTGTNPLVSGDTVRMLSHGSRMDGSRAARELGVTYTPLETGLRRAIQWYWESGLIGTRPRFLAAA
jgi:dihydroflavonol-4-reductase